MKTKQLFKMSILMLFSVVFLTSCATIISGTTERIHVRAINSRTHQLIPGAMCTLTDSKGHVYALDSNPDSAVVSKGAGPLTVNCKRAGYRQKEFGVGESFDAWTIANVIVFWPGIIVDAVTGAIQKYPSHVTVLMEPNR